MFEDRTFENILNEMLEEVSNDIDKREGSVIYDALAPTALKVAEMYADLKVLRDLAFADTADGDHLERRIAEFGVYRRKASAALRKLTVVKSDDTRLSNIELGFIFTLNNINFSIEENLGNGEYTARCAEAGVVGNTEYGNALPYQNIEGLGSAVITDVLIPGSEEESDESLYERFIDFIREKAFGGNRADYKRVILNIAGVGAVRLSRAPFGGGTVLATILDSAFSPATQTLVDVVQETVDPKEFKGDGYGTAPIGAEVTARAAESVIIDADFTLVLDEDITIGQVEGAINDVFSAYLLELRKGWPKGESINIRITHLEARLLGIEGIQDITNTTLNGSTSNITIENYVPEAGAVTAHE